MKIEMPSEVKFIISELESHEYEAFAVGGCIRDSLLGRTPNDVGIPHGIDEGLFFDLPRRRIVVLRPGRRPQKQCSDQKQTSHVTASLRGRSGSPGSEWR